MLPLQTVVSILSDNPEAVVVLAVVLRLARWWQTDLTWTEYRSLHRLKRGVFPILVMLGGRRHLPLIGEKGGRADPEYHATVRGGVRDTVRQLRDAGASLHLLCSLKRRPDDHGDPLTDAHVVWTVGGEQVEAYLFDNDDATVDVYVHTEASTDHPLAHLTGGQVDGDTHGVLPPLADVSKG